MEQFIHQLMARMTLEEKIGQLNLISVGDINTGAPMDCEAGGLVKAGKLGAVLNLKGVDKIKALHLNEDVEEKLLKEVGRLAKQPFGSGESAVILPEIK